MNLKKGSTKVLNIVYWGFGVCLIVAGVIDLFLFPIEGLTFIIMGLVICPFTVELIKVKTKIEINKWIKVVILIISVLMIIGLSLDYLENINLKTENLNISYDKVVDSLPDDFNMESEELFGGERQVVGINSDGNVMLTIRGNKKDIDLAMLTISVGNTLSDEMMDTVIRFLDIFFPDDLGKVTGEVASVMLNNSTSDQNVFKFYDDKQLIVIRSKELQTLVISVIPILD